MNLKRIKYGIGFGIIAGIVDVIPMIAQNLSWDSNLSAFTMWVVIGFILSITDLPIKGALKGILIAYPMILPCAILVAGQDPMSLVPILIMTLILGSLLGYSLDKFGKKA